jgi:hypothetical protein
VITGWGAGAAALAGMACAFVYIISGDESWAEVAKLLWALSGAPSFFTWLG